MEVLIENIIIYASVILLCLIAIIFYLWRQKKKSNIVEAKIIKAKEEGLYEPISLHPVVDESRCIKTGACISACPEKDILGIRNGKATTINASHCIGHGACFHACPTEAISLHIGTEMRGIELPHVNQNFETNVQGVYIAGELGGMRIGATLSVIGAIVGELVDAKEGLGFLLKVGDFQYDTSMVFVAVIMLVALALSLYGIVTLFEKRFLKWQNTSS